MPAAGEIQEAAAADRRGPRDRTAPVEVEEIRWRPLTVPVLRNGPSTETDPLPPRLGALPRRRPWSFADAQGPVLVSAPLALSVPPEISVVPAFVRRAGQGEGAVLEHLQQSAAADVEPGRAHRSRIIDVDAARFPGSGPCRRRWRCCCECRWCRARRRRRASVRSPPTPNRTVSSITASESMKVKAPSAQPRIGPATKVVGPQPAVVAERSRRRRSSRCRRRQ